ncbi:unnamed protein product [Rhizophagus irregularis]|nr:unnamed protein product [Rhizophagus irregularis]CAB5329535.1 unnamed protein product [Rhizophagus irregularis]
MSSNADNSTSALNTITDVANSSTSAGNVPIPNTNTTINTGSDWTEQTIRLLINQRKHRNREYYQMIGRNRKNYWKSISRRINREAGSNFTGIQCRRKFNNLVSHYYDICYFMCGRGKYTDIGERYFEEFNTLFWHRPVSMIQNVQRTNISTHRRRNRDNVR